MHWSDEAIILSSKKHGETSAVTRLFARTHGVYAGVIKGAISKANRGVIQPGNSVSATWQARLSEHLGTLKTELMEPIAAFVMQDAARLAALTSICAIIESALPERHPYERLYELLQSFLKLLKEDGEWPEAYVRLELDILADTGFGLDLSQCAATGATTDLIYVSPKSGRAVSQEAGEPYKDKLLPLPGFLLSQEGKNEETLAGLRLTGYFLDHWLLAPHNRKLPAARERLINIMKEAHARQTAEA